ncbi:MAG: flavodoxin family protein [Clostridia bacterium]|nr:flavodoxin family protein [Clostridia bacterium]
MENSYSGSVILINGSPHAKGSTYTALSEMAKAFEAEGIKAEIIHIGDKAVSGCRACFACAKLGKCVIDDCVNEVAPKFIAADGIVVGSPVYIASPAGTLVAFLDRLFESTIAVDKRMKVGAAVACLRRAGATATTDMLNKYFTISGMPVASSCYWNLTHGRNAEETANDAEGMHTMRTLARNMSFLIKSIRLGKEKYGLPEAEPKPKH